MSIRRGTESDVERDWLSLLAAFLAKCDLRRVPDGAAVVYQPHRASWADLTVGDLREALRQLRGGGK